MQIIDQSIYNLPGGIRKILLIQLGDIGDVVWATPGIRAVKESIPDAQVSVLVKEGFGGLLEADPDIERVYEAKQYPGNLLRQAAGQLAFIREIRRQHFDLAVDLRLGDRGAFMSFASGAPLRITLHHYKGLPAWRRYVFTHGIVPGPSVHKRGAAEQSLRILRGLGIDTEDIIPRLWVSDNIKRRVREIIAHEKMDGMKRWITFNPFSRWSYKEWDAAKWVEVINWLWQEFAIPVIIIGSPAEKSKADAFIRQCEGKAFNFAGLTTLAELAGVLSLSHLHIGVDSAAPHIAAAVGVPTVTIYGPSSWKDWAPVGKNHRVILPEMDCVPCHQKGCDGSGRSRCLDALNTGQVKIVLREALEGSSSKASA